MLKDGTCLTYEIPRSRRPDDRSTFIAFYWMSTFQQCYFLLSPYSLLFPSFHRMGRTPAPSVLRGRRGLYNSPSSASLWTDVATDTVPEDRSDQLEAMHAHGAVDSPQTRMRASASSSEGLAQKPPSKAYLRKAS